MNYTYSRLAPLVTENEDEFIGNSLRELQKSSRAEAHRSFPPSSTRTPQNRFETRLVIGPRDRASVSRCLGVRQNGQPLDETECGEPEIAVGERAVQNS